MQSYFNILSYKCASLCNREYLLHEFSSLYKNIQIAHPPVKVIEAIEISESFIPIFEIFTEGRHNNFESVYFHDIQGELSTYYLNKNKPLEKGLGNKFCDQKPETKFLSKPVLVFGDVKIVFYSFEKLNI